jgi:nitrous oxidase accessory protein
LAGSLPTMRKEGFFLIFIFLLCFSSYGELLKVGEKQAYRSIQQAINASSNADTILVEGGVYKEKTILVDKSITLIGENFPVLDGEHQYQIISVKANRVVISGFKLLSSGLSSIDDIAAIKIYDSRDVVIRGNILVDAFFGIYVQSGINCRIENNTLNVSIRTEQQSGNGIHCWKCDSLQIIGNRISGHRDGIYFEFVTNSIIWRNISSGNLRYGLHFMFSNSDAYITNVFRNNGAGVSVMFTHGVKMINNFFEDNWGDGAYGLLLKEISDSYVLGNKFKNNTSGIYMEGVNRVKMERNEFKNNGWGLKIQASCMDNEITGNNFLGNTFDISTNGTLVLNSFNSNYWDKYEGYDLDKNNTGDIPYHPLSIFSVIVEKNPPAMLLYRSFMVSLLDKSEKIMPTLTPDNFIDNTPLMHSLKL